MPTPQEVIDLIERFKCNREAYLSNEYNEAQVRLELINPFFKALGWDMYNEAGYAEAYKDVVHEDAIKIGGATKAPDYAFRIGGVRKFFVEAKRPGVNIKNDPEPAYQLRRYAWSAKLPLSILTDFEEFAVYDCRVTPNKEDKASTARTIYLRFEEYEDRWDEIASIFSQGAIPKGSFDRYAESAKKKRGTAEVDDAFLKEIETWRDLFARNIALRNPSLSTRELNYAVQRTVDRIIFLRICEDRGIETYGQLRALQNGTRAYERLCQIFRRADERYNSGLFHFTAEKKRTDPPDDLTLNLTIDDKVLKEIFKGLYYPESPFEFSVLPADILGHIYEQFLGKVIRLTPGHRAKVEDKPEVKKAGGVYYTPTYIVDYIVKNTVGKLLERNTPTKVAKIRVLDPACGSGSFLLGAYQYLLDWHQEWYAKHDPQKHAKGRSPKVYQGRGGEWRLTTAEKKRILLNNIYGVDIDTQAVEVTKLSLLLKVLEGESSETLGKTLRMFHERALPDLGENIKCGNSLIGPDFYEGKQLSLLDDEERYRINAFDWNAEFPEVFTPSPAGRGQGEGNGFDAVIGNPPWGGDIDRPIDYYHLRYPFSTQEHTDSFKLFIDSSLRLAKEGGLVSMIVPNTLLQQRRIRDVRRLLLQERIHSLVDLGEDVFAGVVAPACVFVVQRVPPVCDHRVVLMLLRTLSAQERVEAIASYSGRDSHSRLVLQEDFKRDPDLSFLAEDTRPTAHVVPLGEFPFLQCKDAGINYQRVGVGMKEKGRSDLSKRLLYEGSRQSPNDMMYWKGSDIDRYWVAESTSRFCRTHYSGFLRPNEVVRLNKEVYGQAPKILLRQTADHIIAAIDKRGIWFGRSIITVISVSQTEYVLKYFLGILNSKYFRWLYQRIVHERGRVFAQVKLSKLKQLPIRTIDFSDLTDKANHDRMVELVETMLKLHKHLAATKTNHEKTAIQRQINVTDKQIDQLVYELYGLTEEEIGIIEEGTK